MYIFCIALGVTSHLVKLVINQFQFKSTRKIEGGVALFPSQSWQNIILFEVYDVTTAFYGICSIQFMNK